MKKLGFNIRRLRELRNFTQQYMADNLNMTQGNYARIENGEINIKDARLEKIAEILGYSVDFICNFDVAKIVLKQEEKKQEEDNSGVVQYKISPELKEMYEGRIRTLEAYVEELKSEIQNLNRRLNSVPANATSSTEMYTN